jgi:hypothetical protein
MSTGLVSITCQHVGLDVGATYVRIKAAFKGPLSFARTHICLRARTFACARANACVCASRRVRNVCVCVRAHVRIRDAVEGHLSRCSWDRA